MCAGPVHQVRSDQKQIVSPVPERGNGDRQRVETVVQVFAEGALPDTLQQVFIGGGDDPHIRGDDAVAAHPHEFLLLQHAQQLDLQRLAHGLNLVQKERAPVGVFEEAQLSALPGAGEGAFVITEQLALQQGVGKRGAVDGHKGKVPAAGGIVNGVGEQLFAGAALAGQEDGRIRGCHSGGDLLGPQNGVALTDDIVKGVFGLIAPVVHLQPELLLPLLLGGEPLEQQEASDIFPLPVHRRDGEIEIGALQLDQAGGLVAAVTLRQLPGEGGAEHVEGLADGLLFLQPQHALCQVVDSKAAAVHINAQNTGLQRAHQDVQIGLRLQVGPPQGCQALPLMRQGFGIVSTL